MNRQLRRGISSAHQAALRWLGAVVLLALLGSNDGRAALTGRKMLAGSVPSVAGQRTALGELPGTNQIYLAIGLPLHNGNALDELFRQIYDPQSTNYHQYLTPSEFTARFGPTEQDYQAVVDFAAANGLTVAGRHANRLVLDVHGSVASVERAFQTTLRTYRHPTEPRNFFAPDVAPSVPLNVPVNDMWGLTDYQPPQPLVQRADLAKAGPQNYNGSGPSGRYQGGDFRHAYVPGSGLGGSGQTAAVAEFDGYYASDITKYEAQIGCTNVPLQNVIVDSVSGTPGYSGDSNAMIEVSLDIEMIVSMAPALSSLLVYEGSSPYDVFNKIVTDDLAKQISCSWTFGYGPTVDWKSGRSGRGTTLDSQLEEMGVQGQSFFQAAGD
jgi:subtilase family serine protease